MCRIFQCMKREIKYISRENNSMLDDGSVRLIHNQRRESDGKYWNEIKSDWCTKKSKAKVLEKGEIRIFDFEFYPLSKIREEFGLKLYERVGYFITRLYCEHMIKKKPNEWEWMYWDYKKVEKILSKDDQDMIIETLMARGILKVHSVLNWRGKMMKYFKLSNNFKNLSAGCYKIEFIKGAVLSNAIKKYFDNLERENDDVLKFIKSVLLRSSLKIENLDSIIDKMWKNKLREDEKELELEYVSKRDKNAIRNRLSDPIKYEKEYKAIIEKYYEVIQLVLSAECEEEKSAFCFVRTSDFGGRISHLYSNTPKQFRKHLQINGSEVVEVDIKSSQPSFLYLILERINQLVRKKLKSKDRSFEYIRVSEFLDDIKANDPYELMSVRLNELGSNSNKGRNREKMKNLFFRLIYGNPKYDFAGMDREEFVTKVFG
jgi:hypothetical protein